MISKWLLSVFYNTLCIRHNFDMCRTIQIFFGIVHANTNSIHVQFCIAIYNTKKLLILFVVLFTIFLLCYIRFRCHAHIIILFVLCCAHEKDFKMSFACYLWYIVHKTPFLYCAGRYKYVLVLHMLWQTAYKYNFVLQFTTQTNH